MAGFEDIAKDFLTAVTSDLDTYVSMKGQIVKNSPFSFTLHTAGHIQWAFAGRGPGKLPPLEEILNYIKSKNIIFEGMSQRSTAFMIQRSIGKNGTKNYKKNAPNAIEESVKKYQKAYEKELGVEMSVDINDQIKKAFDKIWEKEESLLVKFKI